MLTLKNGVGLQIKSGRSDNKIPGRVNTASGGESTSRVKSVSENPRGRGSILHHTERETGWNQFLDVGEPGEGAPGVSSAGRPL